MMPPGRVAPTPRLSESPAIRLRAARKIGELVPAEKPLESGAKGGRGKKASEVRNPLPITPQRLSEFRKLAKIPRRQGLSRG